ncbi:hypothetical protein [Bacteroides acidifaciens]|jgi:hypothetical protein|uniref:hypothetical protein n=1 Tax=Bacteroides acidifaciens TaxID=85831 RepID=UPI002558303E|nr:hypothetical protein [Bacteroides acidifaciens]
MLDLGGDLAVMMYLSKGILCKGGSKNWLYIRHLGQPTVLNGEEAVLWQESRFHFSYTMNPSEMAIVQKLVRKGVAVSENGRSELEKYHALCRCSIRANPNFIIGLKPFNALEKRILTWLRKTDANLSLPELICLEDKGIKPERNLLYRKNSTELFKLIYPCYESIAGDLENKMRCSIARQRTIDALLELLRRKRVVII